MKQAKSSWYRRLTCKRLWVCLALFAVTSFIAYKRYPTYLLEPSFYAEDGTIFAKNVIEKGFLAALFTPFNGYFITGVYLLECIASILNGIFGHGNLLNLPVALAVTSYAFWGFICTLPLLLFWRDLKQIWLILAGVCLAMLPLPAYNYAILGTVGNYKFAFLFIAFLLLIKRMRLQPNNRWIHVLDAGLVLCAFTNATVYLLLPIALLPYWPGRPKLFKLNTYKKLLRVPSFISLLVMFALVCVQLAYVALQGGVDELQGYLQEPYEIGKTIEIFLHRTLLFPFDHLFAKSLNDIWVLLLSGLFVAGLFGVARREDRVVVAFGLYAALAATALFVSQRTGVSQFYGTYQTSGPDQFFYTQNLIILFVTLYVLGRAATVGRLRLKLAAIVLGLLLLVGLFVANDFSKGAHMNRATGDFRYAAGQACVTDKQGDVTVPIYPVGAVTMDIERATHCPELKHYTPTRQPLAALTPAGNAYVQVDAATVTQTFRADYRDLSGVSLFLSTFGGAGDSTYTLRITDRTCQRQIRSVEFNAKDVMDNSYHDIRFPAIEGSKGRTYCFALIAKRVPQGQPALAVQFSAPGMYAQGAATKDGVLLSEDVVFDLLYRQ